jgi:flagellin
MSSLLTNTSAMTALAALTQTQMSLSKTQNEVSTGLRISSASDNAAYWSIATKMDSNVGALGAVKDALSNSKALVETMSSAMKATIKVMNAIKDDLVTASSPDADLAKIQTDIDAQQNLLISIGKSSVYNGQNWLTVPTTAATTAVNLVASYDTANGVSYLAFDTANTQLFDIAGTTATQGFLGATFGAGVTNTSILNIDISTFGTFGTTAAAAFAQVLTNIDAAISSLTTAASQLGATTTNLTTQQTYIADLSDSLKTGVGALIDADMNEAATKLAALQVQQQLGVQALSISNSNAQLILQLFK